VKRVRPRSTRQNRSAAGYAGKPLALKLGVKAGMTLLAINAPPGYRRLLGALPPGTRLLTAWPRGHRGAHAFIHYFASVRRRLARQLPALERGLAPAGALWISWPKRAAGVATALTEADVRALGIAQGLVDVKVCAVDETWSGLKFVRRLKDR
jgi:hypothetical protein